MAQRDAIRLHDEMDVRVRQAEEEAELEDCRNSASTAGFDCQPDETSNQKLAARERRRFPLDIEKLQMHVDHLSTTSL